MTAVKLVDAAAAIPPAAAVAEGIAGIIRYVSQEPAKNLTAAEAAGYHAAGLTVTAVYEDGTTDYEGGTTTVEQHGAVARGLLDAIGYPTDRGLIVAVDTDIQPADYAVGLAYVQTTASVAGRVGGAYGPDAFVRYCMANGVRYGMNASGWRDGVPDAAQIQQGYPSIEVGGTECDPDVATAADYGQWPYAQPPGPAAVVYVGATVVPGKTGDAWFLLPDGGVDGRDVAGASAPSLGGVSGQRLAKPVVSIAATPSGSGYWLVAEDGGVFNFGDATFHGSAAGETLAKPVVGIVPGPAAQGYALIAADGGVFVFGDFLFRGSAVGLGSGAPVVGGCATGDGGGYWIAAADGSVFPFGDAALLGTSVAGKEPGIAGIAACGSGYVLAGSDGSVEAFGTPAHGDYPSLPPGEREGVRRFVGVCGSPAGDYTLLGNDGTQYRFG
jgi:hypothetical protein